MNPKLEFNPFILVNNREQTIETLFGKRRRFETIVLMSVFKFSIICPKISACKYLKFNLRFIYYLSHVFGKKFNRVFLVPSFAFCSRTIADGGGSFDGARMMNTFARRSINAFILLKGRVKKDGKLEDKLKRSVA